ncbi:d799b6eb-bd37-4da1-9294-1a8cf6b4c133 [Thermothielavioides terrestris]|uniref:D799b6eb-bd37-4da1-9294-1a8cf6b4c133 n=1 Tax=Thermothielavioides terrestris TaxID=2587410 RepID=A0A3S4AQM5_9PEZI|nr:d799b6eb-bd37-4da1-9294-1a8cf6b4c133 [Thermothielavioides terrestris]
MAWRTANGAASPGRLGLVWLLCLLWHGLLASAATVTYDFNITWLTANPDGMADRPTIGINGQWPIPTIRVNVGDRLVVNVLNSLGNESASLHFHGLFMRNATHMDGPAGVTQCPIPPGSRFTYNFTVDQPGTYWYHSHIRGQYPDGLRGPLIVHDPDSPFRDKYDEELVMTVSDWYHDPMPGLLSQFLNKANPTGAEPVPNSALLNDTQNLTVSVQPGKTYLFRMINIGAFAGQYVWFEGHNMTILEVDGVYTHPAEASMIYLAAAQRCSFLITAKNDTSENFPIVASMDTDLFDKIPDGLNWNVTGWLVYDSAKPLPDPAVVYDAFEPFDDIGLVPAFFNDITYVSPKVPTLYTALSAGDLATNSAVYGTYTHPLVLEKDQVVEILINNLDSGKHPFHLHGHEFQVIWRSDDDAGTFADSNVTADAFPAIPMKRDTVVVRPNGNMVLRFKSNNPGIWLFHCHIEWHVASGLMATIVEAPLDLQKTIALPSDHLAACAAAGVPTAGNAAGNTVNFLDLTGQNAPPPPLPAGFTPRGIVALVFSCVSGILGVAVVSWYGFAGQAGGQGAAPAVLARQGEKQQQQLGGDGQGTVGAAGSGSGADAGVGQAAGGRRSGEAN